MLVNQPMVADRSAPGITSCSRPWPSSLISAEVSSIPRARRHLARASARAASRPSLTLPWNAAGTRVSSASVTSAGRRAVNCSRVERRSRAGSSGRVPSSGSGPSRVRRHSSISASRCGLCASSTRACVQRRTDVPDFSSRGVRPALTCSQAAARSGSRIRHDTPSTAMWCRATIRRPCAVASAGSNHTKRAITPAAVSSRPVAAFSSSRARARQASSQVPSHSTRWSRAAASTEPSSATTRRPEPSSAVTRRERRMSCRSITASRVAVRPSASIPAGRPRTRDMENRSYPPPSSRMYSAIGSSGNSPVPPPSNSSRTTAVPVAVATRASSATVRCSKICRGVTSTPWARARVTTWMERMESPPTAKKSSSTPIRSAPRTSA
ncbi:hypothetical protein SGRIM128S_04580 [Streptomyces griseomycini]